MGVRMRIISGDCDVRIVFALDSEVQRAKKRERQKEQEREMHHLPQAARMSIVHTFANTIFFLLFCYSISSTTSECPVCSGIPTIRLFLLCCGTLVV